jgi:hypothetical protein
VTVLFVKDQWSLKTCTYYIPLLLDAPDQAGDSGVFESSPPEDFTTRGAFASSAFFAVAFGSAFSFAFIRVHSRPMLLLFRQSGKIPAGGSRPENY